MLHYNTESPGSLSSCLRTGIPTLHTDKTSVLVLVLVLRQLTQSERPRNDFVRSLAVKIPTAHVSS